jgi:hypothetical protein
LDLEELTCGLLLIPSAQVLTGLTGADPWLGFSWVNVLVSSLVSEFAAISSFECFGAREVGHLDLGFPSLDRSDR